jgi:hypothetical protein
MYDEEDDKGEGNVDWKKEWRDIKKKNGKG